MKNIRRWLSLLLTAAMLLGMPAALAEGEAASLQPGDVLDGFTVTEVYESTLLASTIYTFDHAYSGAKLVYVKNDDPELAFGIGYHTPYVDETDTNHVFEHAILAGSEKYPSSDLFFDLINRSYNTFVNASTSPITTMYPVSSQSEDQLMTMMDAYMSCMVAPEVLQDERYFKREAVRFELSEADADITINGTVFAEDLGQLTDLYRHAYNNALDALYPGETASNMNGHAYEHYDDLTYEHTIETFERCYHFDNSMIFLYGDLDLHRFLSFLDGEYLSKYSVYGTDLSAWEDGITAPGYVEKVVPVPAYEGDTVDRASMIQYVIDLDGASDVELFQYGILGTLLNQIDSPLYNLCIEQGVESPVSAGVNIGLAKPFFSFTMSYADPEQRGQLKAIAEEALTRVARDGIDPALLEMIMKASEREARLLRNDSNVGVNLMNSFISNWAASGEMNYFRVQEQAMKALNADGQQQTLRRLALNLLTPRRSALVASVPTPGLAEEYDQQLAQYLSDMKAAMTDEEIAAMVAETAAFNEWNEQQVPNNDFLISVETLPEATFPSFTKSEVDGVTVYSGTSSLEGVGKYTIYFDLSGMSREEMEYLMLTSNYIGEMNTRDHVASELNLLVGEYLSDMNSFLLYPGAGAGDNHRPMLGVGFTCLTEDFDKALDLILELYTQTDYRAVDMLQYLTLQYADDWDMSRQDGAEIGARAARSASGLYGDTLNFRLDVDGQGCYDIIADAAARLAAGEEGFAEAYAQKLTDAAARAFTPDNVIFMSVSPEDESQAIIDHAVATLKALPAGEAAEAADYALPEVPKTQGICVEDSMVHAFLSGDYLADEDFLGSYLPFQYALSDAFTVPAFRFQMGAYSALSYDSWILGELATMVYSAPDAADILEVLGDMPAVLEALPLDEESFEGYVLNAYGASTAPQGVLSEVAQVMQLDLLGADLDRMLAVKNDIRNASIDLLPEAASHITGVIENSALCLTGNEGLVQAVADDLESVISYRHGD